MSKWCKQCRDIACKTFRAPHGPPCPPNSAAPMRSERGHRSAGNYSCDACTRVVAAQFRTAIAAKLFGGQSGAKGARHFLPDHVAHLTDHLAHHAVRAPMRSERRHPVRAKRVYNVTRVQWRAAAPPRCQVSKWCKSATVAWQDLVAHLTDHLPTKQCLASNAVGTFAIQCRQDAANAHAWQ